MADQPQPHQKPQFSPRIVGWAVTAGSAAAIAAVVLVSAAPPAPFSNLLAAAVASAVGIAAALFLAGLVLLIAKSFGERYDDTAQSVQDYQREMTATLLALADRQVLLVERVADLDERAKEMSENQKILHNKIARCIGEVSTLSEAVGQLDCRLNQILGQIESLTTAFIEEGLPDQRGK
jgi:hypothetical protein